MLDQVATTFRPGSTSCSPPRRRKFRHALAALTSRDGATASETDETAQRRRHTSARARHPPASGEPARSRTSATLQSTTVRAPPKPQASRATTPAKHAREQCTNSHRSRSPPRRTKAAVLAALAHGRAMTAGEVANATGLDVPTVSITRSNLSEAGELTQKQLVATSSPAKTGAGSTRSAPAPAARDGNRARSPCRHLRQRRLSSAGVPLHRSSSSRLPLGGSTTTTHRPPKAQPTLHSPPTQAPRIVDGHILVGNRQRHLVGLDAGLGRSAAANPNP